MTETIKCIGCGVEIQTEDKNEVGYAPASSLEKEQVICQRCFRLKHYNEIQDVSLTDDDFLRILNGIGKSDALVVKIVDILILMVAGYLAYIVSWEIIKYYLLGIKLI